MNDANILLFIELRNKSINLLLNSLREIFNDRKSKSNIHITVRGPFKNKIIQETIDKIKEEIKYDVIKIEDIGYFVNDDQYVVFIKIDSPNLEKVWKKSDYPKYKHGFNPHISLYRGDDENKAMKIYNFLVSENISLLCEDYEFVTYDLNQRNLMDNEASGGTLEWLESSGRIKLGLVDRAKQLMRNEAYETK